MNRPLKAAVIGAGHIARQHLACLGELAGAEVVGVCDLSRAMAEAAAERHGAAAWYTDHRRMLAEAAPDVVHVATPPASHFALARDAFEAGAHVIVEKPATVDPGQLDTLLRLAEGRGKVLVEDYNYVFNKSAREVLRLVASGDFGEVVHVEALMCVDALGPGSPFADPNAPHPTLSMPGGPIADFLPHLASLAHAFVGPHRDARTTWTRRAAGSPWPSDEFRALVEAERGTAALGFSASARPEVFWLRVYGTRMSAVANLFETRLTVDRVPPGPVPLRPVLNGLREARDVRRGALSCLHRKLAGGGGVYEGLWELVARTYEAIAAGAEPPVTARQVVEVNRLVADLVAGEVRS